MASAWGSSWGSAWGSSWGTLAVVLEPLKGGHRIPNKYVPIDLRRANARAAKRRLDEERRRLSTLKKQQQKVEVQYKAIILPEPTTVVSSQTSDKALLLELELKEFERRVALQAVTVRRARQAAELARREAARQADERELQEAHEAFLQAESLRLEQESDDEMRSVLLLIHEDL